MSNNGIITAENIKTKKASKKKANKAYQRPERTILCLSSKTQNRRQKIKVKVFFRVAIVEQKTLKMV